MSSASPTRVAFLGCGNIAGGYATSMSHHPQVTLVGVHDLDADRRRTFAREHDCLEYPTLDALVDDSPDIVVNLTPAPHHYAATLGLIAREQNVFSEKPLALEPHQARELVRLAAPSVRVACAPSVWLGVPTLAAAHLLSDGEIGPVRLITAEVSQGRIESWHPTPQSFYGVGPVVDAGIYPLAYLTALFGPIRSVSATAATSLAERHTLDGQEFTPTVADTWVATAMFASGPMLRLSCNFFVSSDTVARTIDFHGDDGSLRLDDWILPGAAIHRARYGEPFTERVAGRDGAEIDWSLGLLDLAEAMRDDRPHRTAVEHAAHVVDVLDAVARAAASGERITIDSDFPAPYEIPQLGVELCI